jgi:hypothetical protein
MGITAKVSHSQGDNPIMIKPAPNTVGDQATTRPSPRTLRRPARYSAPASAPIAVAETKKPCVLASP